MVRRTDTQVDLAFAQLDLHLPCPARAFDQCECLAIVLCGKLQEGREEVLSVPCDAEGCHLERTVLSVQGIDIEISNTCRAGRGRKGGGRPDPPSHVTQRTVSLSGALLGSLLFSGTRCPTMLLFSVRRLLSLSLSRSLGVLASSAMPMHSTIRAQEAPESPDRSTHTNRNCPSYPRP